MPLKKNICKKELRIETKYTVSKKEAKDKS